jgi:hypothetical protein
MVILGAYDQEMIQVADYSCSIHKLGKSKTLLYILISS